MKFKVVLEDAEEGGYIVGCLESLDGERAKAFGSQAKVVGVTV